MCTHALCFTKAKGQHWVPCWNAFHLTLWDRVSNWTSDMNSTKLAGQQSPAIPHHCFLLSTRISGAFGGGHRGSQLRCARTLAEQVIYQLGHLPSSNNYFLTVKIIHNHKMLRRPKAKIANCYQLVNSVKQHRLYYFSNFSGCLQAFKTIRENNDQHLKSFWNKLQKSTKVDTLFRSSADTIPILTAWSKWRVSSSRLFSGRFCAVTSPWSCQGFLSNSSFSKDAIFSFI